jgi:ParB-like chromosome segregation protein Spo0J
MARRKIMLQDSHEPNTAIEDLVQDLGDSERAFRPTTQMVYEVELARIKPDEGQARHFLPHDLRHSLAEGKLTPRQAMQALLERATTGDRVARLILGDAVAQASVLDSAEGEDNQPATDTGLQTLANSIKAVGLRQPINIYTVVNPQAPGEPYYRIGEGERRDWAHQLLVVQGHSEFEHIRSIIEPLPENEAVVRRRQEAENAARQDLSAIARARAIARIKERLNFELGTRVPDSSTIKLPSQRDLQTAVGQEVKLFTGRAISDRMVRNYLSLLNLPPAVQDLAEAANLTEKQLRAVTRLDSEAEQLALLTQIIDQELSGRTVTALVRQSTQPPSTSLKQVKRNSVEERLEKRLVQTATTAHEVLSLDEASYRTVIGGLIGRLVTDEATRSAVVALRQMLDDLLADTEQVLGAEAAEADSARD